MTRLYIADISALEVSECLNRVTPYRREHTLRLKSELNRKQSLGAELLLYRALGGLSSYSIGENGKPYLDNGTHFSLSHSGNFAVCAVSDKATGVDIEGRQSANFKLARRFFTDAECRALESAPDPDELFTQIWVTKESYIKATGLGLKCPLSSFEASEKIGEFETRHMIHKGMHLALCVKGEIGEIEIHDEKIT